MRHGAPPVLSASARNSPAHPPASRLGIPPELMKPQSFRNRLTLAFLLSVIVVVVLIAGVTLTVTADRFRSTIIAHSRQLLRTTELQIDSFFRQSEVVVEEVLQIGRYADLIDVEELMDRMLMLNPRFEALLLADRTGRIVAAAPSEPQIADADIRDLPAYGVSFAEPQTWPRLLDSPVSGEPSISVSVAADGLVALGYVALDRLQEYVTRTQIDGETSIFVTDPVGYYVAHPDPEKVMRREASAIVMERNAGELELPFTGRRIIDGVEVLASVAAAGDEGWPVIVYEPVDSVFSPVNELIFVILGLLMVILVATAVVASLVARALYTPLKGITGLIGAVEAGSYEPVEMEFRYREFAELGATFNRVLAAVRQRELSLAAARRASDDELALRRAADQTLRAVVRGTIARSGQDLFDHIASVLVEWLGVDLVLVSQVVHGAHIHVVAAAGTIVLDPEEEYAAEGAPCGEILRTSKMLHLEEGVQGRFPDFAMGSRERIDGYVGIPLRETHGGPIQGVICAMSRSPLILPYRATDVLEILAVNAAGEFGRRATLEELNEARDDAVRANQAKSEFLANMSHEIRTPINGIQGMARLVGEGELKESQREYLRLLERSADNLLLILNDLLDFSAIEAGRLRLEIDAVDVVELVRSTVVLSRAAAEEAGLEITFEATTRDGSIVRTDEHRVRQVLVNLISNAIKYTKEGGIAVRLRVADRMILEVQDTGIGIAPERLEQIFESFLQLESSYTKKYKGIGLGLAIARQLVELLGGAIRVQSEPGRGSVFTVDLPVHADSGTSPGSSAADEDSDRLAAGEPGAITLASLPESTPESSLEGARILVAEDEAINRLYLSTILRREGVSVIEAPDGERALDLILAGDLDLAILDISMPVYNGLEVARMVREQATKPPPLIALTAHAFTRDRDATQDAGMSAFLAKPIDEPTLLRTLRREMQKARTGE